MLPQCRTTKAARPLGVVDEEVDHEDAEVVHVDVVERVKQVRHPLGIAVECQVAKIASIIHSCCGNSMSASIEATRVVKLAPNRRPSTS